MTLKSIFESIINFDLSIFFKIFTLIILIWIGYYLFQIFFDWIKKILNKIRINGFMSLTTKEKLILCFSSLYLIYFFVYLIYFD
jgi:hypothetical protein